MPSLVNTNASIGIDLGTTCFCVGAFRNGKVEMIPNGNGDYHILSQLTFLEDDHYVIGNTANILGEEDLQNNIFCVKRMIGKNTMDQVFKRGHRYWPFQLVDRWGYLAVQITRHGKEKLITPELMLKLFFTEIKHMTKEYLGQEVTKAVVSVPACFNAFQRHVTKKAGRKAGFRVLQIINEPTATAVAYGLYQGYEPTRNLCIVDLGGGMLDISIISIEKGVIEVRATCGDADLGGEDFDHLLMDHCLKEFKRTYQKDPSSDKLAMWRLQQACRQVKHALSCVSFTRLELASFFENIDFNTVVTRTRFEELCSDLFQHLLSLLKQTLWCSQLTPKDIDDILLVGGSTRIPKIKTLVQTFFDNKKVYTTNHAKEMVACGAAIRAAILSGDPSEHLKHVFLFETSEP